MAERFQIRMPDGLRDRIRLHAAANNRSMNAEIVSLLESGLFEADWARIESGFEPLREMRDEERKYLEVVRANIQERKEREANPRPPVADIDIPFFDDGPTQREIFELLFKRLDRIEEKLEQVAPEHDFDEDETRFEGDGPEVTALVAKEAMNRLKYYMSKSPPESKEELRDLILDLLHEFDVPLAEAIGVFAKPTIEMEAKEGSRASRTSYIGPDRHRPQRQHFPDRPKKG